MISTHEPPARVLKFGGAALADGPAVRRACEIIASRGGARPVVIVSALEGVTAILEDLTLGRRETRTLRIRHRSLLSQLELPSDLMDPFLREMECLLLVMRQTGSVEPAQRDHLLSFGERMSARIVAAALRTFGMPATAVDAHDLGIVTKPVEGEMRLLPGAVSRIREAIAEVPGIPVVTGFMAVDERGNLTTLGPNGSDLTALFVGQAIGAGEVQLWKTVAGIQTADPKLVPQARTIGELGFDDAIEIARNGACILHHGAALAARHADLTVRLCQVQCPDLPGTRLVAQTRGVGPLALVHREDLTPDGYAAIALIGIGAPVENELANRALDRLRLCGIDARARDSRTQSGSVVWLVPTSDLAAALNELHRELFPGRHSKRDPDSLEPDVEFETVGRRETADRTVVDF